MPLGLPALQASLKLEVFIGIFYSEKGVKIPRKL